MAQTSGAKTKNGRAGEAVAISAGLTAIAAASYYFFGPKGEKHRKDLKSWSIKMRGDVIERLEKLQDVSEPVYRGIVDAVAARYERDARASRAEVAALAKELKETWHSITSSSAKSPKKPRRTKTKRSSTPRKPKSKSA